MSIPLVGQPVEAYECVILVTAKCTCSVTNAPFVILGMHPTVCQRCGKVFAVVRAMFDRRRGAPPVADIAVVGQATEAEDHGRRDHETHLVSPGTA